MHRRAFLAASAAIAAAPRVRADEPAPPLAARPNPIGVSTYSFWQFKREEWHDPFKCIDLAAELGFDGVELLHKQLPADDHATLQKLKAHAFRLGVPLMGFSIHQGF